MQTLISMELSAAEAKKEEAITPEAPKYPWGLCLTLNNDTLKKLNIETLPEIGAKLRIVAEVEVEGVRASSYQAGDTDKSVDLQITDMAVVSDPLAQAASTLYGK